MDFLVESDIVFNGLNNLIFEYLNFRPFLKELSDVTFPIFQYINNTIIVELCSAGICICRNENRWDFDDNPYDFISRKNLHIIYKKHNMKLEIKDNHWNFGYRRGLNVCYMYY